jgi:hypothetical protein
MAMPLSQSEIHSIAALVERAQSLVSDAIQIAAGGDAADLIRRLKDILVRLEEAEAAARKLANGVQG